MHPIISIPFTFTLLLILPARAAPPDADHRHAPVSEPTGALSLADATALTLARSPRLDSARWDVRLEEAAAIQAATRPNPEISFEAENVFGQGDFRGFHAAEETLSVGQTIELGRKRQRRIQVAASDIQIADCAQLVERTEVLNAMAKAFHDAVAARQIAALAAESLKMQEELSEAQAELLKAGKISESEVESVKATLALAKIEADTARSEDKQAKLALAAHWGSLRPKFSSVSGSLATGSLPSEKSYREGLRGNPILKQAARLIERQQASVALEKANRVPDITAGIGGRHFEESGDAAVVFQLSIPIPLFDRNQGNIERARAELGKAQAERERAVTALETMFTLTYERLAAAHREASSIASSVLPSAERGHRFTSEGYMLGKFSYLELKAAQATLIGARRKLVAAQLRFHQARADLEALAGRTN